MPLNINLKPEDSEKSNTSVGEWSYTYGKYLLILFNIVLFALYTYKVSLIRKNSLLKEELNKMQERLESLNPQAKEYNDLQKVADLVKKAEEKDVSAIFLLNFLKTGTPKGITIKDMSASQGKLSLTAISTSPEIFSSFVASMISEKRFKTVILVSSTKMEKEDSYMTKFNLSYK